jgi:predicted DNA-binding ribbon-helix-helix protein
MCAREDIGDGIGNAPVIDSGRSSLDGCLAPLHGGAFSLRIGLRGRRPVVNAGAGLEARPTSTSAARWLVLSSLGGNMRSPVVAKRSIYPNRHNTSVTLEDAFWQGLNEIAHRRRMSVSDLIGEIDAQPRQGNLSSALRVFVLEFYRRQIPDAVDREGVTR